MDTDLIGGWFYLPFGVMTHFRPYLHDELLAGSVCDIEPDSAELWQGNGSPEEIEKSAALPHCRKCSLILGGAR